HLSMRWTGAADRLAFRKQPLENPDRLEEIEGKGFLEQMIGNGARTRGRPRGGGLIRTCRVRGQGDFPTHRSCCSATRGGHFLKYPSPCLVLPTSCVKELMCAYSARKRSRT